MNNKNKLAILGIIILLVILIIISFNFLKKEKVDLEDINYNNLQIISEYSNYVLAIDKTYSEITTYAIYKKMYKDSYQKLFSLQEFGENIEKRHICWDENSVYIINHNPISYDLLSGKIINTGDINKLLNNTHGDINRVYGINDNYLYYSYNGNGNHYYAKSNLDFTNIVLIEQNEVPFKTN